MGWGNFLRVARAWDALGWIRTGLGMPKTLLFPYFGLLEASSGPFSHYLGGPPLGHAYCPFKGPWPIAPLKGPCLLPLAYFAVCVCVCRGAPD